MGNHFFAYFVVSSNHDGFDPKDNYNQFESFAGPNSRLSYAEHYLNSAAMQDHCIATFVKRVEPYMCARYRYWDEPVPGKSRAVPMETDKWLF